MSSPKPKQRRWFGARSENSAEAHLRSKGYRILARNYTCKLGELDLVALDGATIVFVEVRSTGGDDPLQPARSVDTKKQRQLTKVATYYLKVKKLLDQPARFDVVTLHWPEESASPSIQHFVDAFDAQ